MKKFVTALMTFLFIFLAACGVEKAPEGITSPDDNPTEDVGTIAPATIEYGEPDIIANNSPPLFAYIRFPVAGNSTDEIISDWANNEYQKAQDDIAQKSKEDSEVNGEINIQFDSYFINNRYAGVIENGMYSNSHLAHPGGIVQTFNIDTKYEKLLTNGDILDYTKLDGILSLLKENIIAKYPDVKGSFENDMDESWLEQIAIGHDGIFVVLNRADFLPSYLGTIIVTLPYDKLGDAYIMEKEAAPAEPPAPTPEPPSEDPAEPTAPPQSSDIDPSKPMVALTFDDGPSKYTGQLLDILEQYGVRASFFVVGNLVDARKDTVKREIALGCEVMGHSWDHKDLSKLSDAQIRKQINETSAVIKSAAGTTVKMYRPPYGAVNATVKSVSADLGYAMILWSVDPEDWKTRNADAIHSAVMKEVKDKDIVLSHDLYGTTVDAYKRIIPELLKKGYQLVTVSELMQYSNKKVEAGKAYESGR